MKILKYAVTALMMASAIASLAQGAPSISGELVTSRIAQRNNILNDCIQMLAQQEKPLDVKQYYMKQALGMFLNEGEAIQQGDSTIYEGAYIITSSPYRNKPVKRRMKDYLQGVLDHRYAPVDIINVKLPAFPAEIAGSSAVKAADDVYRYDVVISREFAGYIDGTPVYRDITPYVYPVYVKFMDTVEGKDPVVLLTGIEVEETATETGNEK